MFECAKRIRQREDLYFKMVKRPSHESVEKLNKTGGDEKFSVDEQPGEFVVSRIHIPKYKITLPYFERFFKQLLDRDTKLTRLVIRVDGNYFFFNSIEEMITNEYITDRFKEDLYRKDDMFSLGEVRFNIVSEHGSVLFRRVAEIRGERKWVIKEREIITNLFIDSYLGTEEDENAPSQKRNERINREFFRYTIDNVKIFFSLLLVFLMEVSIYLNLFFSSWFVRLLLKLITPLGPAAQFYFLIGFWFIMLIVLLIVFFGILLDRVIDLIKKVNAKGLRSQITQGKNYYGLIPFFILFILLTAGILLIVYLPQLEYFFTNPPASPGNSSLLLTAGPVFFNSLKFLAVYIVGTAAAVVPIMLGIKTLSDWWTKRGDA